MGAQPGRPAGAVPPLIFPVVGSVSYSDDFGDARGQGRHEGNDLLAAKRSPAVAAEAGTVTLWTTSARAGCMLYLRGASGTTYLYVHLNNDLGEANDNRGGCVAGVAYAKGLVDGARVAAGQQIGYVGDSGDADGAAAHLHFEVHPGDGAAVSPYRFLRAARRLLFAARPGSTFTLALRGTVATSLAGHLSLKVDSLRSWPGGVRVAKVERTVELQVPAATIVTDPLGALLATARLRSLEPGQSATAWTAPAPATLQARLGLPLTLATERVVLAG